MSGGLVTANNAAAISRMILLISESWHGANHVAATAFTPV
jgi:hypothetical protein